MANGDIVIAKLDLQNRTFPPSVEEVQDVVEHTLFENNEYQAVINIGDITSTYTYSLSEHNLQYFNGSAKLRG